MKLVEILYSEGCPHWQQTLADVEATAGELGIDAEVRMVRVRDAAEAEALRFLGSPTVRVEGRDVETGVGERRDHVLACRIYTTEAGLAGRPPVAWIRGALAP
jgi:hypothetical protein